MRSILIIFLVLVSVQVNAQVSVRSKYKVISQSKYIEKFVNSYSISLKRYILVDEVYNVKSSKSISNFSDKDSIISATFSLLKKRKDKIILNHLVNNSNDSLSYLIEGIYRFYNSDYSMAINSLKKFKMEEYTFLKYLLLADCISESANNNEVSDLVKFYQKAYDSATTDTEKHLVKNRIKLIRYN